MEKQTVSPIDPYMRHRIPVLNAEMAYIDTGRGDPIVFLHGNPTSSYLWRNIIPHLEKDGRCLAPDLIGMGESDKVPGCTYRFADHARYLDAWFDSMKLNNNVTLVIHDWGSALGFYWAFRHPERIKAIAYMEAIVQPVTWDMWPKEAQPIFQGLRSPAGEDLVLEKNIFIELLLPASVLRGLTGEELDVYRRPYQEAGESRRPMLTWPREIPIDGEPSDVHDIVSSYGAWLKSCDVPKLFINADPGVILTGKQRDFCRTWAHQLEITVKGSHFIQEDSPAEIGVAISRFLHQLPPGGQ
ncbi:MAG TPA: haloalkane dehalogenase [Deltaproteobacteria bacterium]|nr:haloalkane dehalogenase [Deltaproteobacteria bacterium]